MKEPKFKVGDVLKPVLDDTGLIKCHVAEILTQVCSAGIEQITYLCRVHTQHYKGTPASITREYYRMGEFEVEVWQAVEKPLE